MRLIICLIIATLLTPATTAFAEEPRPLAPHDLPPAVFLDIVRKAQNAKAVTVVGTSTHQTAIIDSSARYEYYVIPTVPQSVNILPFAPALRYVAPFGNQWIVVWQSAEYGRYDTQLAAEQAYNSLN